MQTSNVESALAESLARLETALLTPVASGELASWAETCRTAADEVARRFPEFLHGVLHREYAEIARTDDELLRRVQQMKDGDSDVASALADFHRRLSSFAQATVQITKHEGKVEDQRAALERDGIELIVRIRKQKVAADLWLAEAVYRDRGAVD